MPHVPYQGKCTSLRRVRARNLRILPPVHRNAANNPQMELDLLPFALSVLAYLVLFALLSLRYLKKRDIAAE